MMVNRRVGLPKVDDMFSHNDKIIGISVSAVKYTEYMLHNPGH